MSILRFFAKNARTYRIKLAYKKLYNTLFLVKENSLAGELLGEDIGVAALTFYP